MTEEITFLAFNYGMHSTCVNGPGMCMENFVKILKRSLPHLRVNIFTALPGRGSKPLRDSRAVRRAIEASGIVHHWSGIGKEYSSYASYAKRLGKKVLLGPNVIDTVEFSKEKRFLAKRDIYHKVITVNQRLAHRIALKHNLSLEKIGVLMVGPDLDLWSPSEERDNTILWKGNSKQYVKDVGFGLEVAKKLDKYDFKFIGHPKPYSYLKHIEEAKKSKIYFSTSLSETMGLALAEQWAAGVPSVTHPKIYLHGENYLTGIIANRDVDSYCEAIEEIMEDNFLYDRMVLGSHEYALKLFSDDKIISDYSKILI